MSHTVFEAADAPDRGTVAPNASARSTWGYALALAAFGTAIFWKSDVGINWGLWIAGVVVALVGCARERFGFAGAPAVAAGSWAIVLALGTAVTTAGPRAAFLILISAVLLAIALVSAGQPSLDVLHSRTALLAPFVAIALTLYGLGAEATGTARNARSPRFTSIARSALITLPVIIVLILLLGEADPLFAAVRDGIEHLVPADFVSRFLFFCVLLAITLGAYGSVQSGETPVHAAPTPTLRTIGQLERRVLLTALASIMWLFVISATLSLTRNPAAKAGSGITYAEYVHRGFAELSLAATLVIGVVLVTRRSWLIADPAARRLALIAIAGVGGMIAIAFLRVVGYEQVYGFTVLRLYAQAYMVVLASMSVLLAIEISRRAPSTRFSYHSATAALAVLAICVFWNTDAWIVRHNVDRYMTTGKIDVFYITSMLSDDATPALVDSVVRLREPERSAVTTFLRRRDARRGDRDPSWYAWNLRASASAKAARAFHGNDILGATTRATWNATD